MAFRHRRASGFQGQETTMYDFCDDDAPGYDPLRDPEYLLLGDEL